MSGAVALQAWIVFIGSYDICVILLVVVQYGIYLFQIGAVSGSKEYQIGVGLNADMSGLL